MQVKSNNSLPRLYSLLSIKFILILSVANSFAVDTLHTPLKEISFGKISKVYLTKSEKYLITATPQCIRVWDVTTQQVITNILADSLTFETFAVTPNDSVLISTYENSRIWRYWRVPDGEKIQEISMSSGIDDMEISPKADKLLIKSSSGVGVYTWSENMQSPVFLCGRFGKSVFNAHFSPDGSTIAFGSQQGTTVFDANSGAIINEFFSRNISTDTYTAANVFDYSPDGSRILIQFANWNYLGAQDVKSDSVLQNFEWGYNFTGAKYSPDGKQIACSTPIKNKKIYLLDSHTGDSIRTIPTENIYTIVDYSTSGKYLLCIDQNCTVRLVDMQSISSPDKVFNGHSALLHHIDCSPDGTRILTTGIDNAAKIWSLKTGELIGELAPDSGYTLSAGFSKDGTKIVTGGSYGFIRLWDAVTLAPIKNLVGITQEISTIVFSPDGKKIAANTNDGKVFIWNTLTGNLETTFSKTNTPFFTMKYSPDGTQLGLAMWTSWICNSTTGEELWSKTSVAHQVGFLDFSPVGSLIALSEYERKILICSATTGDSLREFQGCLNEDFIFTPNGKYLLSGSSAMAFLYDITTGEPIKCFKLLTTVLNSGKGVAVSKDGSRLFTSLGGRVQVWDGTEYSSIKNTQPKPTSINTKTWYFNNSTNTLHFPKVDNTINMTYNLQLFEMSGRRITSVEYTMKNRSAHIHLPQQLPPGLYFFRIESNLGSSGTGTFISIRK